MWTDAARYHHTLVLIAFRALSQQTGATLAARRSFLQKVKVLDNSVGGSELLFLREGGRWGIYVRHGP